MRSDTHRRFLSRCALSSLRMRDKLLAEGELNIPDRGAALRLLKAAEIELLSIHYHLQSIVNADDASRRRAAELCARRDRLIRYSHALCHCSIYPVSRRI